MSEMLITWIQALIMSYIILHFTSHYKEKILVWIVTNSFMLTTDYNIKRVAEWNREIFKAVEDNDFTKVEEWYNKSIDHLESNVYTQCKQALLNKEDEDNSLDMIRLYATFKFIVTKVEYELSCQRDLYRRIKNKQFNLPR